MESQYVRMWILDFTAAIARDRRTLTMFLLVYTAVAALSDSPQTGLLSNGSFNLSIPSN